MQRCMEKNLKNFFSCADYIVNALENQQKLIFNQRL